MGAADAVPGVSGGTIALIVGVYDRFIGSLATVLGGLGHVRTPEGRRELARAFGFLIPLGLGVIVAWYAVTRLLVGPAESPGWLRLRDSAPICYAFFFGLVLASLREPWRRMRTHTGVHVAVALAMAAGAAWFVGLPHATAEPEPWMLLYGGALAVAVMLLPGISGSLLLLILGQYTAATGAVHDRDLVRLGFLFGGILLGLATFVPFLRMLLRRHHDVTLAALTGLMAGSLRALWPWKSGYEPKQGVMENVAPFGAWWPVLLAFLAGMASVYALARLEHRIAQRGASSEPPLA